MSQLRNMTEGSPARHLFFFALPLFFGSLLQQFYNMADSFVVGNFVGDGALAAVGIGWPVLFTFTSFFMGLGTGGTVVISQHYGAGHLERVRGAIDTLYTAFLVAAVPLSAAAALLVSPLLTLLQVDASFRAEAQLYLVIVCGGLFGSVGYNINSGILQGLGDSRSSVIFLAVSSVVNIIGDLVLVLVFELGVVGVAVATVFAQCLSWIFGIFYINRKYPEIAIRPLSLRFDKALFKDIVRIGLPAGIQMATVGLGSLVVMAKINSFGEAYTAAYNVGNKLDNMAWLPVQAITTAVTAFVGQNVGAQRYDRARKGIAAALGLSLAWCALIIAILMPLRHAAVDLFTDTAETIEIGARYLWCIMPFYPFLASMFCINNSMRGAGDSVFPMICILLSQIFVRVPVFYFFADNFGPYNMYYTYGVTWAFGALLAICYYLTGRWKRFSLTKEE